ncbi:unnamed protein product, partial [Rotaria sp. Silwood2]
QLGQQILGHWSSKSPLQTINCNGVSATGVTHTSADNKVQVQAVWYAPAALPQGPTL